ncbi:MAG: hypothetical protein GY922_15755 [Proteobacteria bacterium]|nr:hypothetical protein [Pseudomonadota bacterium]
MKLSNLYFKSLMSAGLAIVLIGSASATDPIKWAATGHMTTDGRLVPGIHPQLYGLDVDHLDIKANNSYVYALMTLVSHLQRGEISEGQMKWLYERAIGSAVPRNYIEEFMAFNHSKANLKDHMVSSGGNSIARVLLYDVTQMIMYGDRYDKKRRSRKAYRTLFTNASRTLEVSRGVSRNIQAIVNKELRLLNQKTKVFWGETPYQPPRG